MQEFKFTKPTRCQQPQCNNRTDFTLKTDWAGTEFGDWQRIRIQESEKDIPAGSMPRSIQSSGFAASTNPRPNRAHAERTDCERTFFDYSRAATS